MTFHPAANYSIHTQCWSNWERSQRDNFPRLTVDQSLELIFTPASQGWKSQREHLILHASQEPLCQCKTGENKIHQIWKAASDLPPPLLPPAQLQVKGAQRPQRKGWECRLSIITEITNNVPAMFTFLTLLILPIQSRVSVAFVCWDYIHGSERVGISH